MTSVAAATSRRTVAAAAVVLSAAGCSAQHLPSDRSVTTYRCAGDRSFRVERDEETAVVLFSDVRYELPRRSSSIGQRYATSGTTLIIDGRLAAFVSGTVLDLDFCRASETSES